MESPRLDQSGEDVLVSIKETELLDMGGLDFYEDIRYMLVSSQRQGF